MCCPSYTVRLNVHDFVPSKNQRKVQRKLQKYLDGDLCDYSGHAITFAAALGGALSPKPPSPAPPSTRPIKTDQHASLRRLFGDIVDAWCESERLDKVSCREISKIRSAGAVTSGRHSSNGPSANQETAKTLAGRCLLDESFSRRPLPPASIRDPWMDTAATGRAVLPLLRRNEADDLSTVDLRRSAASMVDVDPAHSIAFRRWASQFHSRRGKALG